MESQLKDREEIRALRRERKRKQHEKWREDKAKKEEQERQKQLKRRHKLTNKPELCVLCCLKLSQD